MANPSSQAIAWIQGFIASQPSGSTDAQIVQAANAPAVANPTTQGTVETPYTLDQVLGMLGDSSIVALNTHSSLGLILESIESNDRAACLRWLSGLAKAGTLTASEATALQGVFTATESDPSWQAQIGQAEAALGRPIDLDDVATTRTS